MRNSTVLIYTVGMDIIRQMYIVLAMKPQPESVLINWREVTENVNLS